MKLKFESDNMNIFVILSLTFFTSIIMMNYAYDLIMGDVFLYKTWANEVVGNNYIYGVNTSWVYPYFALIPILTAKAISSFGVLYSYSWVLMIFILDLFALICFNNSFKDFKIKPYVYFGLSTVMLFGLYLGRLDAFAIALTIIGISLFKKHPTISIIILSIGLWIKIWPVAFIIAFFFIDNKKIKFAAKVVAVNFIILFLPFLFGGSWSNILGFLTSQKERGVQLESMFGIPWLAGLGKTYFDDKLLTWQFVGEGVAFSSQLSNYLLIFCVAITLVIGLIFGRKNHGNFTFAIMLGSILLMLLIIFNKVGSAQYAGWIIIPVMFFAQIDYKKFKPIIWSGLTAILATGLATPVLYDRIISQDLLGITIIVIKYLAMIVTTFFMIKYIFSFKGSNE